MPSIIGIEGGRRHAEPGIPMIAMATAHPAKFPDAMEQATGARPPLPPHLADLYERPETFSRVPNSLESIEAQVRAAAASGCAVLIASHDMAVLGRATSRLAVMDGGRVRAVSSVSALRDGRIARCATPARSGGTRALEQ
jgi:hypothetical protein